MENSRIEKLVNKLGNNEGILITNEKNCFYFSGISASNITLYITKEKRYLITDFRYYEAAMKNKGNFEVLWKKNLFESLSDIIDEKNIYVETDTLTFDRYEKLKTLIKANLKKANDIIYSLRIIKDEKELTSIKEAQKISDKAFLETLNFIKPGVTEKEVKTELEYNMLKYGSEKPSFDTIVLFGKNTSLPHGIPSDNKLKTNDIILIDFGSTCEGYCSDTTRTFFINTPEDRMVDAYNEVLYAHNLAKENIKPGILSKDADCFARDYLSKKKLAHLFGHSLGHGAGLDIHEAPTLSPKGTDVLKDNMTFSIEPGVYFENDFGIRTEDLCYLKNGCVYSFTDLDKNLLILK